MLASQVRQCGLGNVNMWRQFTDWDVDRCLLLLTSSSWLTTGDVIKAEETGTL